MNPTEQNTMNEAEQIKRLRADIAELAMENESLRIAWEDCDQQNRMLLSDISEMRSANPNAGVVQAFPKGRW